MNRTKVWAAVLKYLLITLGALIAAAGFEFLLYPNDIVVGGVTGIAMEEVNDVLYESKLIGYPAPFKNKVRTFCQNPGGYVAQENYDNDLAVVNGHSFKDRKSANTNVAILCSHNFSVPFNQPIAYAQKVGELTNMRTGITVMPAKLAKRLLTARRW